MSEQDVVGIDELDVEGLHVVDLQDVEEDDGDEVVETYGTIEDCIDTFAEAFAAHDVDTLVELLAADAELPGLGGDRAGFTAAMEQLWDLRPDAVMTRGDLDERPVGIVWDVGEGGAWQRIGIAVFDCDDLAGEITLVELVEDATVLDEATGDEPWLDPTP